MNCKIAFFLSVLLTSTLCIAEMRDPTKPAYYSAVALIKQGTTDDLNLSSIWISKHSKRATINGIVAKQGDVIFSDIKVMKIDNNSVRIKQNGVSRKLKLLTHSLKTRVSPDQSSHD